MSENHTAVVVQHCLDALAEDTPEEPHNRALLYHAVGWLEVLCATMLFSGYPRLTRPSPGLQTDAVLEVVVKRSSTGAVIGCRRRC
jgi:hypothetical protein